MKLKTVEAAAVALIASGLIISAFIRLDNELPPPGPTATAAVEKMQRETWLVDTGEGYGSAVHFKSSSPLPQLLTAAHVVRSVTNGVVTLSRSGVSVKARIVWLNTNNDVALLESPSTVGFGPGVVFALRAPIAGERVQHVGYFLGKAIGESYSEGVVSAVDRKPGLPTWPWKNPLDQMILPALGGSSGGPVFNTRGECVGILVGGVNCSLFYYVPVRQVLPLLKRSSIVTKRP